MFTQNPKCQWESMREAVAADDTAISVFKHSNMPAIGTAKYGQNTSVDLKAPNLQFAQGGLIAAWGAGGDNKAITAYRIYATAVANGPIVLMAGGVMTSGSQACTVHPITGVALTSNYWVDTITVTSGILSDLADILDSGNNRICMLKFPFQCWQRLFMEYDEAAGGMTAFNAMITGW